VEQERREVGGFLIAATQTAYMVAQEFAAGFVLLALSQYLKSTVVCRCRSENMARHSSKHPESSNRATNSVSQRLNGSSISKVFYYLRC
jgi:hypothetical protein